MVFENDRKRQVILNSIFYLAEIIYLFSIYFLRDSNIEKFIINKDTFVLYISYITIALLLLKICLSKFYISDFLRMVAILLLSVASYYLSNSAILFISIMFILASQGVDYKKVLRIALISCFAWTILVIILFAMGFIPEISAYSVYIKNLNHTFRLRRSLGFSHVNLLGTHIGVIVLIYYYLRFERIRTIHYIILGVLTFIIFITSFSRTSIYAFVILAIAHIIYLILHELNKENTVQVLAIACCWLFPIFSLLAGTVFYNYTFFNTTLNNILAGRISDINVFFKGYGFSILGQDIELRGTGQVTASDHTRLILDNAYTHLGIHFGIIMLFLFLVAATALLVKYGRREEYNTVIVILVMILWGTSELTAIRFEYNVFMILSGELIYRRFYNEYYNSALYYT